jgi:hypothetical protein
MLAIDNRIKMIISEKNNIYLFSFMFRKECVLCEVGTEFWESVSAIAMMVTNLQVHQNKSTYSEHHQMTFQL